MVAEVQGISWDISGLYGLAPWYHGAVKPYYQDEAVTIYHGDCREILPLVKADVLVTDPPYGISHSSNHATGSSTAPWLRTEIRGDGGIELRDAVLSEWCGPALVFGTWKVKPPIGARTALVWDKGPASGMGDLSLPWKLSWEMIYVCGDGFVGARDVGVISNKWVVSRASMGRAHPNEKPVELLAYLLSKCPLGTVLDPFAGSGTTLRAAKDLGRKAIGIEIEERYCEIAARRCAQEVMDLSR